VTEAANVWEIGPQASLAAGFQNPPEPEPLQPRDPVRVGGYTLIGRLGVGGMGVAYLARDEAGREVALKVVHAGLAEHEEFRARFIREVTAARRVSGRHTARVLDADALADPPWLATEYFRCWTLEQQVPRFGALTAENAGTLIAGLADALATMHARGLVHRDLKPSNILLAPDGPRIIDFGLARAADLTSLTTTGRLPGTPGYMAPEQIEGRETGPPADVFALGANLVYATTGTSPFWHNSPTTLMHRTVHGEPDLGAMPEGLREVTLRCLAKEAGDRPTAAELAAEFGDSAAARRHLGHSTPLVIFGGGPATEAVEDTDSGRGDLSETERIVPIGGGAISSRNIDFPPPARRRKPVLVIGATAAGLMVAALVALALATSGGSTAAPPVPAISSRSSISSSSTPSTAPPTSPSSRSGSAIPAQPPPLPRTLVGYSGRLLGQDLAWFLSLRIPAASAPWSGGGLWSAIAGPGCPGGAGHSVEAAPGWSPDPTHGGAAIDACAGTDLVASTVVPGQAATAHVTWTFTPGTAVSSCALFAYNAASPANRAFGDYTIAGRAGQFPMSGASHAGEWVELGVASPRGDGTVTVGLGDDQAGDAQHPSGPTVTATQVVAVCGGPST
jgi:serine/threonine protein kinase